MIWSARLVNSAGVDAVMETQWLEGQRRRSATSHLQHRCQAGKSNDLSEAAVAAHQL